MACKGLPQPTPGLFLNNTQGVWSNVSETRGGRTCTYNNGNLNVAGPNGSTNFFGGPGQVVRHKFFGNDNYLAVLKSGTGPGPIQHSLSIVDFSAPAITSELVIFVGSDSAVPLPWLQHSNGSGSVCLVGAPTPFGLAGLAILRSDTGGILCAGPSPYNPNGQVIGEATAVAVQIKDGGNIIAGPCPFPAGELDVLPNSQSFPAVKVGGCPQPPPAKQFTLKNKGDDCLTISAIDNSGPFTVSDHSQPLPADLGPNETMTVTVTFAPAAVGAFNNVNLPITRAPAKGEDALICSGQAQAAQAGFTASPATIDFGRVPTGSAKAGSFMVRNTGDTPVSVSIGASAPGLPFQWNGYDAPLDCGGQHPMAVTFSPQAEGPAEATVTVVGNPGGTKTVTLRGEGCVANAGIVTPPAPFPSFGDVRQGYRMPRAITINNDGDGPLTFSATISGPDAALFGLMKESQSITDVVSTRTYTVAPKIPCGGGASGDGKVVVAVVVFANAAPPKVASATLVIDNHNDLNAPASFTYPLSATVIAGNTVDVVAVFDTSGSMGDPVPGGGTKMAAALQAGRLLFELTPPDRHNRVAATRFSTDAATFLPIAEVTAGNQPAKVDAIKDPPLTPNGWTAIAAGAMTGLTEFATPNPSGPQPNLTKAMIVLTDGMDNTAFKNPADGLYYSILGNQARDPANPGNTLPTSPFVPPADVKIYAVGLGTGQDIDKMQLQHLSSGAGGYYGAVDPTKPALAYQLMKFYTQIYMDMVDTSVLKDPKEIIAPGQKQVIEFDILKGDVSAIVVMYDLGGLRLPFWLESPQGEIIDAGFVPAGFQLRAGFTETSRFLDFRLPWSESRRYAGRWKLVVMHEWRVCRGKPVARGAKTLGFLPRECTGSKTAVEYGYAIGVGSNFRLQAYVTAGPVKVGEPIRLTAVPTEAGLPVTGCTVTVDVLAPNGQTWVGIVLKDDGAHDDGDAGDGEYARRFTHTAQAGSYTFTFRAIGFTRDGERVTREAVRAKYVEGWVQVPPTGGIGRDCCKRIISQLERQNQLLRKLLKEE